MTLPIALFQLDTIQFIVGSFTNLKELVIRFDKGAWINGVVTLWWSAYRRLATEKVVFPMAKAIANKGISCCIIDRQLNMYSSPVPISEGMLKRTISRSTDSIYIQESQYQDLTTIFKWVEKTNVLWIHMTKFTADVRNLESSLNKLPALFIEKNVGEEDILEGELTSAIQLLDLMSDERRRGRLRGLWIHKVRFLFFFIEMFFKALLVKCKAWNEVWTHKNTAARIFHTIVPTFSTFLPSNIIR